MMQDMWRCKLDWDDKLPAVLHAGWSDFLRMLPTITHLRLPNGWALQPRAGSIFMGLLMEAKLLTLQLYIATEGN